MLNQIIFEYFCKHKCIFKDYDRNSQPCSNCCTKDFAKFLDSTDPQLNPEKFAELFKELAVEKTF